MKRTDELIAHRNEIADKVSRMGYDPNGGAGQAHGNRTAFRLLRQIEELDAEVYRLTKKGSD